MQTGRVAERRREKKEVTPRRPGRGTLKRLTANVTKNGNFHRGNGAPLQPHEKIRVAEGEETDTSEEGGAAEKNNLLENIKDPIGKRGDGGKMFEIIKRGKAREQPTVKKPFRG